MTENCICQSHDLDDLIFGPDSTLITLRIRGRICSTSCPLALCETMT